MTRHRHVVLGILLYVTLDLSMASMPGAFVFDAAQSVESPHGGRVGRAADSIIRAVATHDSPPCLAPAPDATRRAPVPAAAAPGERVTPRWLARAALDLASPSEDPH